ncbi:MAG TPA: sulfite exporter TauE/SafE family protein, partial [Vicinamibacterales bacterium]
AAALLGLLAGAHCVSMCGPLVLAVSAGARTRTWRSRLLHVATYHTGRVTTYGLLGLAAGLAGQAMAFAGFGRMLALVAGALLIAAGLMPGLARLQPSWTTRWIGLAARLSGAARALRDGHPIAAPFAAGMVNGLLPCGMVYAALAAALAAGSPERAVWTMAAFGVGTTPALAGLALTAGQLPRSWRQPLTRLAPAGLVLTGVLLVVRGLGSVHGMH